MNAPLLRYSPSGQEITAEQLREALQLSADQIYSFDDDFDFCTQSGTNVTTTGVVLPTGTGNWWAQAVTGSAAASGITIGSINENHPGIARLLTSASSATNGLGIRRGSAVNSSSQFIRSDKIAQLTAWFALPTITNTRMQIGIDTEPLTDALTVGAMLIYDSSQSPFFQISAALASQQSTLVLDGQGGRPLVQPVASTSAAPIWWRLDILQSEAGVFSFRLNSQDVGTIERLGLPAAGVNVGAMVRNLAAQQTELQIDLFSLRSRPLDRSLS